MGKTENKLTQKTWERQKTIKNNNTKSNNLHNLLYTIGKAHIRVDFKIIYLVKNHFRICTGFR